MMLPQPIAKNRLSSSICSLASRWKIDVRLATRITEVAFRLPYGISILSGFRTEKEQLALEKKQGSMATSVELSTHCSCPATGADLWPSVTVTNVVKATFGEAVVACGLRWGGGSPVNSKTGIPKDWNHVDMGPRASHA